jgi:hypothetical protein
MDEQDTEFRETECRVVTDANGRRRLEYSAAKLTTDEAKLLSFYKELIDGFIPADAFKEVAEVVTEIEDVNAALDGLLAKDVLYCDSFDDSDREEFCLLPQGEPRYDYTLCVGAAFKPTIEKYLPQRE